MIADEVVARQELYHVKNKLKSFVTGEWIRINPKPSPPTTKKPLQHRLPLQRDPAAPHRLRRPPPLRRLDPGKARRRKLPCRPRRAAQRRPRSPALRTAQSRPRRLRRTHQAADDPGQGRPHRRQRRQCPALRQRMAGRRHLLRWPPAAVCPCGSSDLYAAYLKWCRDNGVRNPRESNQFASEIAKLPGWWRGLRTAWKTSTTRAAPSAGASSSHQLTSSTPAPVCPEPPTTGKHPKKPTPTGSAPVFSISAKPSESNNDRTPNTARTPHRTGRNPRQ